MSQLEIDVSKCIGCRTCQIACSFHHKKVFDPGIASLEVRETREWPKVSITLYRDLARRNMGNHLACDDCAGESIALCAKYCPVEAIKR